MGGKTVTSGVEKGSGSRLSHYGRELSSEDGSGGQRARRRPIHTGERPMQDTLAATDQRPAGEGCPRCGSTAFTGVKPVKGTVLTADRQCKACGTRYLTIPASMSGAMQSAV